MITAGSIVILKELKKIADEEPPVRCPICSSVNWKLQYEGIGSFLAKFRAMGCDYCGYERRGVGKPKSKLKIRKIINTNYKDSCETKDEKRGE